MNGTWYYVLDGERQGPVEKQVINDLILESVLGDQDYVWSKGMENWIRIQDASDFETKDSGVPLLAEFDLSALPAKAKTVYIKIGLDRGMASEVEYGPFTLDDIKKLYVEKRINPKTFIFSKGMSDWLPLASVNGYQETFHEAPPEILDEDRRASKRRPLIARMFIQSRKDVFEGICRDISIGGMQVLVDSFPGDASEKININVHPENSEHHFVASGEIVRLLDGGQGFSFRFIGLSTEASSSIKKYIEG